MMTWLKRKKWIVAAIAVVVVGGGVALGLLLTGGNGSSAAVSTGSQTYTVERGTIENYLTVYGEVSAAQEYTFTFDGDSVTELHVKAGQRVEEGDILVELDRKQAELSLLAAESALAEAKAEGVPNAIRSKELSYQIAQEAYDDTTLYAPFAGVITAINQATSSSEAWSLKLIDTSELYIEATVDQLDAPDIEVGQTATAVIEPLPDETWTVEIVEIGGMATSSGNSTVVSVKAQLPEADSNILVGYTVEMDILTAYAEDVLLVPVTALLESPRGWVVTKVDGDQRVPTPVTVGEISDQYAEIQSGLEEGDVVLTNSTTLSASRSTSSDETGSFMPMGGGMPGGGGFPGMP